MGINDLNIIEKRHQDKIFLLILWISVND